MKTLRNGALSCVSLTTVLLVVAFNTMADFAPAASTPFDGLIHFCRSGAPDKVLPTPGWYTLHIRGATNLNRWETGNPLIDGIEQNKVLINFSPVTATVHIDATLVPDAYPGSTWEISQKIHIMRNGSVRSSGVAHGTGALKTMTLKFNTGDEVPGPNGVCSDLPSTILTGVIVAPTDVH